MQDNKTGKTWLTPTPIFSRERFLPLDESCKTFIAPVSSTLISSASSKKLIQLDKCSIYVPGLLYFLKLSILLFSISLISFGTGKLIIFSEKVDKNEPLFSPLFPSV